MKIETLLHFEYQNAATLYFVKASEYRLLNGNVVWRVTIIDGVTVSRLRPTSRAVAVKVAEMTIAGFVQRMHAIYNE